MYLSLSSAHLHVMCMYGYVCGVFFMLKLTSHDQTTASRCCAVAYTAPAEETGL